MNSDKLTRIFISYRRDDTDAEAENIYHHLKNAFGDVVFKDNIRIGPGDKWKEEILSGLEASGVVLALIGKKWFIQDEDHCTRLENEDDWVRKEIEYSIQKGKRLIPVLINGAQVPTEKSFRNLPILKAEFPGAQAIAVSSRALNEDLHKLIHKDLPALGIPLLQPDAPEPAEVDVLADYPLPIKPEPGKLPLPFVGLRPFGSAESFLFFGRDQDILKLIKKLESASDDKKIILYHGRSGVGKSSLLTAGLYLRMKNQQWEVPKPRRRDKDKGLATDLLDLMKNSDDCLQRLLVLDQVEEIFTNPQSEPELEIAAFQKALLQFRDECGNAHLLLSFRSDYFTLVRQLLDDADHGKGIPWDEMELFPLDREGVLKAITGVTENQELDVLYHLRFDPPTLPQDIRDDVLKDKNSSHLTPLLQYQLEQLFLLAAPQDWKNQPQKPPVIITATHYSDDFRKDNLERLLDAEFDHLHRDWAMHTVAGLALDVLYQFITDQATAASCYDADILALYEHIPDFSAFYDYLKNRRSLLIGLRAEDDKAQATRLAHDSLAPLLLARFRDSDAPGQRAWQILEPKLKDLKKRLKPTLLAADDLKIVEDGRRGMRSMPKLEGLIQESATVQQLREAEQRKNTAFIFDSFADVGLDLIISLDHASALDKMKVAMEVDIELEVKKQKLMEPLQELLFFFAEGGRRPELARTAAELLLQLEPDEPLRAGLRKCLAEGWDRRSTFSALLPDLPFFPTLQTRYSPEMIEIHGGTFEMGSPESEAGHQSDEQLHEVKLPSFRMAATPLTFYQYALFCEANEKSIASMTPSWGRFGDHPLVNINWYDACEFCNWLNLQLPGLSPCYRIFKEKDSDKENNKGNDYLKWKVELDSEAKGFRLPTEAEWEFAARGGAACPSGRTKFAGRDKLDEVGWFWENSGDKPLSGTWDFNKVLDNNCRTHPVKGKNHNGIGLYDMSGNVFEWCWDWYDGNYYEKSPAENPAGAPGGSYRVVRGGGWGNFAENCRTAYRSDNSPDARYYYVGFRLVFLP